MPETQDIDRWMDTIRRRYENYLKTSFYFKDSNLRDSFQSALQGDNLQKGPYPEPARGFKTGVTARELGNKCFSGKSNDLFPALLEGALYVHQEHAIQRSHMEQQNIVVATGTASGKTECFLYPILFELYRQYLAGKLNEPGVRAMILYPMNALANDQRERLGSICEALNKAGAGFAPTFGQYIGQTPKNKRDTWRNASLRAEERMAGELVFREEMQVNPPHILLTNYSMLEYLLIRPEDSPLFDDSRGRHWQFIVLDEAHQYRGTKGMEMGMLIRRLKQRLRDGGRKDPFHCIATSATIASGEGEEDKQAVAEFAAELFGERFSTSGIIFGEHESQQISENETPRRYHAFLRALEGAFLVHKGGEDHVILNRKKEGEDGLDAEPLEIALCQECGQHYYVGREDNGKLVEAIRDPSQRDFGVDYFLPIEADTPDASHILCRRCGKLSATESTCDCGATIPVKKCESHKEHPDQLKQCESCEYQRGGIGDPVQEIVHGSDGPNAVIATALHELLPEDGRKVLAFADSRQEAAFFAWYAEDSYQKLRDRNLMLRALRDDRIDPEGLSIDDLRNRLIKQWDAAGLFGATESGEGRNRKVIAAILGEALTDERRLSLTGVGLAQWFVKISDNLKTPESMRTPPWNLTNDEAHQLIGYLLDELRLRRALALPDGGGVPAWKDVSSWPQWAYGQGAPGGRQNVSEWGGKQSALVKHFLYRLLVDSDLSEAEKPQEAVKLMKEVWGAAREHDRQARDADKILLPGKNNGTFLLNSRWLRIKLAELSEIWECDTCASLSTQNIRGVCPRNRCPGTLARADEARIKENHYRVLYESTDLPPILHAEEHTAQIESDEARQRQDRFKAGEIHLLSSSTTFEIGVDLGDLEAVFLRNVPPEPFNYTQRVGRAGRREKPGLALTYCRRNPHDLYHYENPEERVIEGLVQPPRLQMTNKKIISRHMVAVALAAFFKDAENGLRFKNVEMFVRDWSNPCAVSDLKQFCENNEVLRDSLRQIVPEAMHEETRLASDAWIDDIAGPDSRFASAEAEVCADHRDMEKLRQEYFNRGKDSHIGRIGKRMKTIAEEPTLNFLSRKAVIPKYGFPVDVVELDTRPQDGQQPSGVSLQRDLSQAIAEYAPGGKVVANKKEWESCGVKTIPGKQFPIKYYNYDSARNFQQWNESSEPSKSGQKYLSPVFGFVTPLFKQPKEPQGRAQRLYTTRPFFQGFGDDAQPETKNLLGVEVTKALPGNLVILCEGHNREGFFICRYCGSHITKRKSSHKTPAESDCSGTLENFSLGHELVTDVVRLQFSQLTGEWDAYSLAYAILLGAADTLDVPDTDLNVTITGGETSNEAAIVLYDNVPGGAGLVAQLERERIFKKMLSKAWERVQGGCGCDSSCYGCLRSYRNQFAHPYLDRNRALEFLQVHVEVSSKSDNQ